MVKKVATKYFGGPTKRGSLKDQGSMITLDQTDTVRFVSGMKDDQDLVVALRNNVVKVNGEDIPDQTKKSKGKKLIPSGGNITIVTASVVDKN